MPSLLIVANSQSTTNAFNNTSQYTMKYDIQNKKHFGIICDTLGVQVDRDDINYWITNDPYDSIFDDEEEAELCVEDVLFDLAENPEAAITRCPACRQFIDQDDRRHDLDDCIHCKEADKTNPIVVIATANIESTKLGDKK